jgi:hypothetical protein
MSFQELTTAMNGFLISESVIPVALRRERLGARSGPSFIIELLIAILQDFNVRTKILFRR